VPAEAVTLANISKHFGKTVAVDTLDLAIQQGEFFAILGPSGCGKTTTLRIVAGLEKPTSGEVRIQGQAVTRLPTHVRNIGMVFQDYALFPHMKVFDNIAFGLRMRGWSKARIKARVAEALELIQLPHIAERYPAQLSGGQQQRVALARALAPEPSVLLLDEPLSNLDLKLRQELRLEIRRLQKELNVTTIFVTHDQGEALSLSDRVLVMRDGRSIQLGAPTEIYEGPANKWVASFLGDSNFFHGVAQPAGGHEYLFRTDKGLDFHIAQRFNSGSQNANGRTTIGMRPEAIRIALPDAPTPGDEHDTFVGTVENLAYSGAATRYVVALHASPDVKVLVDVPATGQPWREGTTLQLAFPRNQWVFLQD
jgi:spermidine/putrescine transport system ATP-binding protein